MVIIALIVIVAIGTGVAYAETSGGATTYGCMSIAHQGGNEQITTSGLIHYVKAEYYYISAAGNAIALSGAPAPTNGTEIITPAGVSISVTC